jgi:excisionase family DNA binding protein
MTTEPWSFVECFAKQPAIAKDCLRRWSTSQHLPTHKIGSLRKFKLSEVDEWVLASADADKGGVR